MLSKRRIFELGSGGLRVASLIANVVLSASLLGSAFVVWYTLADEEPWNPLGEYPVQIVEVVSSTRIEVRGTKCNDTSEPVTVYGELSWRRAEPPGFSTDIRSGSTERIPGCTTQVFLNDIPEEVLALNRPGDLWAINGTEWPIDENGERGIPRTWTTENFELLAD